MELSDIEKVIDNKIREYQSELKEVEHSNTITSTVLLSKITALMFIKQDFRNNFAKSRGEQKLAVGCG